MSLEHLWAGWRREYIVEATARERAGAIPQDEADCVFCRLAASGPPSEDNLVVWRGEPTFVVLNAYPYASGHVLVLPLRHVGAAGRPDRRASPPSCGRRRRRRWLRSRRPTNPTASTWAPTWAGRPGAGLPAHVHLHVLPRWSGDTNFMTTVAETRVMPETLPLSWKRLTDAWLR